MATPPLSTRDLARRLHASSARGTGQTPTPADPRIHEAALVSEKLRASLTRFAGADGFTTLLRRALVLASAEAPSLQGVKVAADGRLELPEQLAGDRAGDEAPVVLTAHLLGLLFTFIGEPLTLKLVGAAWPGVSLDGYHSTIEADS